MDAKGLCRYFQLVVFQMHKIGGGRFCLNQLHKLTRKFPRRPCVNHRPAYMRYIQFLHRQSRVGARAKVVKALTG